jgi:hypothetical protein
MDSICCSALNYHDLKEQNNLKETLTWKSSMGELPSFGGPCLASTWSMTFLEKTQEKHVISRYLEDKGNGKHTPFFIIIVVKLTHQPYNQK